MTGFQIVAVTLAATLLGATWSRAGRRRLGRVAAAGWSALWLAAAAAVVAPNATRTVARMLGIGRGADLVFYCGILVMFIGFFVMYLKLRRLQEELTVLVRHMAIERAEQGRAPPHDGV